MVYRNRADRVEFLEINAVTARLLTLFDDETRQTGISALSIIADELESNLESLLGFGRELVEQLVGLDILIIAES